MSKQDYRFERNNLKFQLIERRVKRFPRVGYRPVCAVCHDHIGDGADMHEILIPRKAWLPPELVYTKENCGLVHPGGKTGGCHAEAHMESGYDKCVQHLIEYVGIKEMFAYLSRVSAATKGGYPDPIGKLLLALDRLGYDRATVVNIAISSERRD